MAEMRMRSEPVEISTEVELREVVKLTGLWTIRRRIAIAVPPLAEDPGR